MKENVPKTESPTVAIVVRHVPQYRQEFFNGLRQALGEKGIHLKLIYGQPGKHEGLRADVVEIPWGIRIENQLLEFGERLLYWQPVFPHVNKADLIIVEPGAKFLVNFPLILLGNLGCWKIAFWGLGENPVKTQALQFSEWIIKSLTKRVSWYFAFTESSAKVVRSWGFPSDRITVVQNAIDTRTLIAARARLDDAEVESLRHGMGLRGNHIGLFVGGMLRKRRLKFLLEACELIRQQVPDFEMLMIGSGADAHLVIEFGRTHPWLHYLGTKFGIEKVPFFALSKLFLMPGVIGLAILDCLALGVPLVGTLIPDNSHEMDYLVNGKNGVLIEGDASPFRYAQVVADLLTNGEELRRLVDGCRTSAQKYSIENMIANFADGVLKALDS